MRRSLSSSRGTSFNNNTTMTYNTKTVKRNLLALGVDIDESLIERMQRNLKVDASFEAMEKICLLLSKRLGNKLVEDLIGSLDSSIEFQQTKAHIFQVDKALVNSILRNLSDPESKMEPNVRVTINKMLEYMRLFYRRNRSLFIRRFFGYKKNDLNNQDEHSLILKNRYLDENSFTVSIKRVYPVSANNQNASHLFRLFINYNKTLNLNSSQVAVADVWLYLSILDSDDHMRRSYELNTTKTSKDNEFWYKTKTDKTINLSSSMFTPTMDSNQSHLNISTNATTSTSTTNDMRNNNRGVVTTATNAPSRRSAVSPAPSDPPSSSCSTYAKREADLLLKSSSAIDNTSINLDDSREREKEREDRNHHNRVNQRHCTAPISSTIHHHHNRIKTDNGDVAQHKMRKQPMNEETAPTSMSSHFSPHWKEKSYHEESEIWSNAAVTVKSQLKVSTSGTAQDRDNVCNRKPISSSNRLEKEFIGVQTSVAKLLGSPRIDTKGRPWSREEQQKCALDNKYMIKPKPQSPAATKVRGLSKSLASYIS